MVAKVNYVETSTPRKRIFTGKPKDFDLRTAGSTAQLKGTLCGNGNLYTFNTGATSFNAKDMREVADCMNELADILDGKAAA